MSNSIWNTPDQEQEHNEEVLIEYIGVSGQPFYEFDDFVRRLPNLKRWCYITDLIAQADKAERLQKAVDLALFRLENILMDEEIKIRKRCPLATSYLEYDIERIKQLIKGK